MSRKNEIRKVVNQILSESAAKPVNERVTVDDVWEFKDLLNTMESDSREVQAWVRSFGAYGRGKFRNADDLEDLISELRNDADEVQMSLELGEGSKKQSKMDEAKINKRKYDKAASDLEDIAMALDRDGKDQDAEKLDDLVSQIKSIVRRYV